MDKEAIMEAYKDCLCYVCRQSAYMEEITFLVKRGKKIDVDELNAQLCNLKKGKEKLLELKDKLGYEDGLEFMDDVKFQNFTYENGHLFGDYEKLLTIIIPWIENFNEKEPYKYEVGMLVLFHYMRQNGLDKNKKKKPMGLFNRFRKKLSELIWKEEE